MAWSERSSPSCSAAAIHSVYSISAEPSVSRALNTDSTHSAVPSMDPGCAMERANSERLMRPFLSPSIARNCAWRSEMRWSTACIASAVRTARRSIVLLWKTEKASIVFKIRSGPGIARASAFSQAQAPACAAVSLLCRSACNKPASSSCAAAEQPAYASVPTGSGWSPIRTDSSGRPPSSSVCKTMPALQRSEAGCARPPWHASGAR
mmetsp:Transcript_42433/g.98296  ORF Transcript_42433/g.98296 Transcript_42433/m.98296 type:complete len:208 (+) Transcript_42433:528-1151(+)